jgi:hypothetical protein
MPAGPTYTTIASTTLLSGSSSIVFNSIPQTYTDLQLIFSGTVASGATNPILYLNGDTGNNYGYTRWYAFGSGRGSDSSNGGIYYIGDITQTYNLTIVDIMNYTNTTSWKSMITRGHIVDSSESLLLGTWRTTNAVTSVTISNSNNFLTGTTATLIGIKAA